MKETVFEFYTAPIDIVFNKNFTSLETLWYIFEKNSCFLICAQSRTQKL